MKKFDQFYSTVFGRVLIDAIIGVLVGYLIYLWRGNERAIWLCGIVTGVTGFMKAKRFWPWKMERDKK
jgi:hypothetical protein